MQRTAQIKQDARARFWYLPVPDHVREQLAEIGRDLAEQAGGVPDDADHVTLCFVPKAEDDLGDDEVADAISAVEDAISDFSALQVWVGGLAYFDTAVKDKQPATALVALIDGPGLDRLHLAVADALRERGWDWEDTHTFTAHCTLAYLPVGARAADLPVVDKSWAMWTVGGVNFANAEVHHVPFGDQPTSARGTQLPMLSEGPVIAAMMCDRRRMRTADLHGEALRNFRTKPNVGNGNLYPYCESCVHLEKIPPQQGDPAAPGLTEILGCNVGDDSDVSQYSQDVDSGKIVEQPGGKGCPGYQERQSSTDVDASQTVRQAQLQRSADVRTADMIKEVPGTTEPSFYDDPLAADDPQVEPVQEAQPQPEQPPEPEPELQLDPDRYIWRTQHDERVRFSHKLRDGRVFEWDDPPFDGHPGEAEHCRCWSEAIVLSKRCPICGRGPTQLDDDAILADLFR